MFFVGKKTILLLKLLYILLLCIVQGLVCVGVLFSAYFSPEDTPNQTEVLLFCFQHVLGLSFLIQMTALLLFLLLYSNTTS